MIKQVLFCLVNLPLLALGFVSPSPTVITTSLVEAATWSPTSLTMAPRFDKPTNRWIPASPEEGPEGGYDIWGTILRHGPLPFFNRLLKSDEYEQGVLKFMAGDKVDRMRAQAEMDAYLSNPNDWAYNRLKGYNVDYLTIDRKQVALTLVWSALILTLLSRGAYCAVTGDNYWAIVGLTSKAAWCEADNSCWLY